ncbi:AMP-binding protein, partial [Saccharopolyspora tripterygii]
MPAVELSYASGVSDVPLLGDTIGANLDRTAARFPDHDALVEFSTGRRWTYREFTAEVDRIALGLLESGIAKGDRVGVWAPNRAEWTLTQYATAQVGAILVNINPAYRAHELEFVLQQAGVRMLVSAQSFKSSDYVAIIDGVRGRCPALEQVVLLDDPSWDRLGELGRAADPQQLRTAQAALSADDAINIQYTSGTTGFP